MRLFETLICLMFPNLNYLETKIKLIKNAHISDRSPCCESPKNRIPDPSPVQIILSFFIWFNDKHVRSWLCWYDQASSNTNHTWRMYWPGRETESDRERQRERVIFNFRFRNNIHSSRRPWLRLRHEGVSAWCFHCVCVFALFAC